MKHIWSKDLKPGHVIVVGEGIAHEVTEVEQWPHSADAKFGPICYRVFCKYLDYPFFIGGFSMVEIIETTVPKKV